MTRGWICNKSRLVLDASLSQTENCKMVKLLSGSHRAMNYYSGLRYREFTEYFTPWIWDFTVFESNKGLTQKEFHLPVARVLFFLLLFYSLLAKRVRVRFFISDLLLFGPFRSGKTFQWTNVTHTGTNLIRTSPSTSQYLDKISSENKYNPRQCPGLYLRQPILFASTDIK